MDTEGVKVELKPPLTQIQRLSNARNENANQSEFLDDIKHENIANDESQNDFSIEENGEIGLDICGKQSNSKENYHALKDRSTKKAKIENHNICEICKKTFSSKQNLKRHVKTVHDEVREHKCDICGITFVHKMDLEIHFKRIHKNIKAYKCDYCEKRFGKKG